ncbi:MAG TPA: DUF3108 domain-containing protein [Longimicrobium sp.]|nr:DUF3108 domain-containing protein [Longimicrobium sp.]
MTRSNRTRQVAAALAAVASLLAPLKAQRPGSLPFAPGEACTYRGSSPLGRMGSGTFSVARDSAGEGNWVLRFDFRGRMGIVGVENHTRSYFDPAETASYRFTKMERSPLSTKRQDVRMDRQSRRYTGTGHDAGVMPTDAPLDELSFIFFLRTLRLAEGDSYDFTRHYDPARNPVRVRVIGRGLIRVPAGDFQAVEVEMRVRDPNHYGREGVIQIHFTDDARHVPIRLESQIPVAGRMVLSLESLGGSCGAAPGGHAAE